jgi:hypothetical protein
VDVVFELWHFKIGSNDEPDIHDPQQSAKDIGIYSSEATAAAAIERLRDLPGFRNWPNGFRIMRTRLDVDQWRSGLML